MNINGFWSDTTIVESFFISNKKELGDLFHVMDGWSLCKIFNRKFSFWKGKVNSHFHQMHFFFHFHQMHFFFSLLHILLFYQKLKEQMQHIDTKSLELGKKTYLFTKKKKVRKPISISNESPTSHHHISFAVEKYLNPSNQISNFTVWLQGK